MQAMLFVVQCPIRGGEEDWAAISRLEAVRRAVQRAEVPLLAIDVLRWCVQVEWKDAMSCALHVFSKYWSWTSPAARRAGLTCQVEKEHVTRDRESFCSCES